MAPHSIDARTSHRHLLPRRAQWLLLERAAQAGCRIVRSRVTQLDHDCPPRSLRSQTVPPRESISPSSPLGARMLFCRARRLFSPLIFEITVAISFRTPDAIQVKFLKGLEGYILVVPPRRYLSVEFAAAWPATQALSCIALCKISRR